MHALILGTLIFILVWIIAAAILGEYTAWQTGKDKEKNDNRVLTWGLTFLAAVCMWIMWFSAYMHQLNPLILPKNET